ncbi:unnamed protein product, partial [Ostreobium quekettii]
RRGRLRRVPEPLFGSARRAPAAQLPSPRADGRRRQAQAAAAAAQHPGGRGARGRRRNRRGWRHREDGRRRRLD